MIASKNTQQPFRGRVRIVADKRTPFRTVGEVIYSLGQAEFDCFQIAVRSSEEKGKITGLRISTPRVSARSGPSAMMTDPWGRKYWPMRASVASKIRIDRESEDAVVDAMMGTAVTSPSELKKIAAWQGITAVKEDRIGVVDGDLVSRPGPRIVEGLEEMAKIINPELFGD